MPGLVGSGTPCIIEKTVRQVGYLPELSYLQIFGTACQGLKPISYTTCIRYLTVRKKMEWKLHNNKLPVQGSLTSTHTAALSEQLPGYKALIDFM
jgi:hypothetical protein